MFRFGRKKKPKIAPNDTFRRESVEGDQGLVDFWRGILPRDNTRRYTLICRRFWTPQQGFQGYRVIDSYTHEFWIWRALIADESKELVYRGQFDLGWWSLKPYAESTRNRWSNPSGLKRSLFQTDACARHICDHLAQKLMTLSQPKLTRWSGSDRFWTLEINDASLNCPHRVDPSIKVRLENAIVEGVILDPGPFGEKRIKDGD